MPACQVLDRGIDEKPRGLRLVEAFEKTDKTDRVAAGACSRIVESGNPPDDTIPFLYEKMARCRVAVPPEVAAVRQVPAAAERYRSPA